MRARAAMPEEIRRSGSGAPPSRVRRSPSPTARRRRSSPSPLSSAAAAGSSRLDPAPLPLTIKLDGGAPHPHLRARQRRPSPSPSSSAVVPSPSRSDAPLPPQRHRPSPSPSSAATGSTLDLGPKRVGRLLPSPFGSGPPGVAAGFGGMHRGRAAGGAAPALKAAARDGAALDQALRGGGAWWGCSGSGLLPPRGGEARSGPMGVASWTEADRPR
ncbi:hypothetical protein PR202_ga22027 [Eleusine coracana subsp. coracana]|uniref:Uncharacterized protein n=1 Tax=Eleusine coracana subsp. coracana TaxID=191504 RepID=A0AAV5D2U5_ELECO|nr:hypothetical protein PR202_ga22027 [Eleusine coracana subsp. coracana]